MQSLIRNCGMFALAAALLGTPGFQKQAFAQKDKDKDKNSVKSADRMRGPQDRLSREVRHELVMLPYYGVFDNLAYKIDGRTVTLLGQVTRPTLKSDAGNVVKDIEGVERVENQIQVLPLSSMDDGTRIATYRAIYGQIGLDRYGLQAVPPIHIIVSNGHVTLEGVVDNEADKNMAGLRANGVSGVFSVTNNLQVQGDRR